ncbi:hypothetical protein ACFQH6_19410 [Halobacteriaceae archaeon GCM10025711]
MSDPWDRPTVAFLFGTAGFSWVFVATFWSIEGAIAAGFLTAVAFLAALSEPATDEQADTLAGDGDETTTTTTHS